MKGHRTPSISLPAVMHVQWQIPSALLEDTVITHGYFAGSPSQHYLAPFKLDLLLSLRAALSSLMHG